MFGMDGKGKDEKYMKRALELAKYGAGFVGTNPLVGCVIVQGWKIVAEGYYKKFGGHHAEINALKKLQATSYKLQALAMYVTLEPHCYQGKTAPCTDAIISSGLIKRVVVGMKDPNPKVAGKGIQQLRKAGIEVKVGVLQKECEVMNEVFTHWVKTKKPFVVLKVAMTLDGAMAFKKGTRSDFSSPESYKLVHGLRQRYDAIAVGSTTVLVDDPLLTTRGIKHARNPMRVIFDTKLQIPPTAKLLQQDGRTIVFTGAKVSEKKQSMLLKKYSQLTIVELPVKKNNRLSLRHALVWLGEQCITSILVEGGAAIAQSFLREGLVDKLMLTITPYVSSDPQAPRLFAGVSNIQLRSCDWEIRGDDAWLTAYL